MKSYTLTDARNRQNEVFDKAAIEPVLLTTQSHPSYVLMSAETYQQLIERLQVLEDKILGKVAETALSQSQMVGIESFTTALEYLANGEKVQFSCASA